MPGLKDPSPASPRRTALACLLLVLMAVAAHGRVVTFDFVSYDDPQLVTERPQMRAGLTLRSLRWAATSNQTANWFPVTRLSHLVDAEFYGMAPGGHHATNLLLHVANALLLFLVLRSLTGAFWRSWLVAALFAVHPLHVETVAWVSERKGVLSTTFWLLATAGYVAWTQRPSAARKAATAAWLALGLMSKSMLVTLPCVFLLLDYWPLGRLRHAGDLPGLIREKWPFFALVALSCIATLLAQRVAMPPELGLLDRLSVAILAPVTYLRQLIWPSGLAVMYPNPYVPSAGGEPFGAARLLGALALLASASFLALWRPGRPWSRVGWLWYLGTLVPVLGIVQVGSQAHADRYTYVPMIGIYLIVAWTAGELVERRPALRSVVSAAAATALVLLGSATAVQARHWRDPVALMERALLAAPDHAIVNQELGRAHLAEGRLQDGLVYLERAVEISPRSVNALMNLAEARRRQGRIGETVALYERALAVQPGNAIAHNNLGANLEALGQREQAIVHYRRATELRPRWAVARENLERLEGAPPSR
ncbi:MAG: tetratricopeptide repeat protein [Myxococcota bacterium]